MRAIGLVVQALLAGKNIVVVDTRLELLSIKSKELGLDLSDHIIRELLAYVDLLLKWNKIFSLTAITDMDDVLNYHILDGLTVIAYLNKQNIVFKTTRFIDVGSGMGVPGIILAICYRNSEVAVLDSNSKKTAFLTQIAIELGLRNLMVMTKRVEAYKPEYKYDIVVSRAFADIGLFVSLSQHLLADNGFYLAMKGSNVDVELAKVMGMANEVTEVHIPGILDKRFLVKITK